MIKFDFTGRTVIVTGGTRGIGKAVSEAFLKTGANVIATYAGNKTAAEAMLQEYRDFADKLDLYCFDVASYEQVEDFYKTISEKYDSLDVLVNNAGIRRDNIVGMLNKDDWQQVMDTNLTGVFNMSKFAVHMMMSKRYGRIINMTSPSGKLGFAGQAAYASTKAGIVALAKSLSKEVAKRKITVNCVSPGFVETDLISNLPAEQLKEYKKTVPVKRFGKPEEIASSVLFLSSEEAAYITGSVLEITGGL